MGPVMWTDDENLQALFELDEFVRLMGVAPRIDAVLVAVRTYLASWSCERVDRLHATAKGWTPFDECLRPYSVRSVEDVQQMCGSVRIRCRELEASGASISHELRQLDLFFFFAIESLEVHKDQGRHVARAPEPPPFHSEFLPVAGGRNYARQA